VVDGSVHFERIQTFGRLGAELALENLSRVLVQVSNVGLEYVGAGEAFATEHAGQAATCNTGEEKLVSEKLHGSCVTYKKLSIKDKRRIFICHLYF